MVFKTKYGFIPNLVATMAESPVVINSYRFLAQAFEQGSLSPSEQQVVLLTASFENACHHSLRGPLAGLDRQGIPARAAEVLRDDLAIDDPRLEALRRFTRMLLQRRGQVSDTDVHGFLSAGFSRAQVLEVILGVAFKTISNYTNHVAAVPLDAPSAISPRQKPQTPSHADDPSPCQPDDVEARCEISTARTEEKRREKESSQPWRRTGKLIAEAKRAFKRSFVIPIVGS